MLFTSSFGRTCCPPPPLPQWCADHRHFFVAWKDETAHPRWRVNCGALVRLFRNSTERELESQLIIRAGPLKLRSRLKWVDFFAFAALTVCGRAIGSESGSRGAPRSSLLFLSCCYCPQQPRPGLFPFVSSFCFQTPHPPPLKPRPLPTNNAG